MRSPVHWKKRPARLRYTRSGYKIKLCLDSYFYHLHNVSYFGTDNPRYHNNRKEIFQEYKKSIKRGSWFRLDKKK